MVVFALLVALTVACAVIYAYMIWRNLKTFEYDGIPYVPGVPFLGNLGPAIFQKVQVGQLIQSFYNLFPEAKYFGIFDCDRPIIVIRDPELIKQIAIKNFENFTDHYGFTIEEDKIFANSLFQLSGNRWKDMRALLTPAFTSNKLKQMFVVTNTYAKNYSEHLVESIDKGTTKLDTKNFAGRYTNDVICKFAFGIDVDSLHNPKNEIYQVAKEIFAFDGPLSMRMFLNKNFPRMAKVFGWTLFTKKATDFFTEIMKNTIKEREEQNIVNTDMLQMMLDALNNPSSKVKVDIDDIMSQTLIFMFGGYDTTSSFISTTLYLLAAHPEVQDRLIAEVDEVYKNCNGDPSYDDLQQLEYMDCVLNEVGRIYSPAPYTERKCTQNFELPPAMKGFKSTLLTPGTTVYFPVYAIHHDPKYFENPDQFDPDRFSNSKVNYDSGYYIPFGIGRRICIGARLATMEMKILLFHLLRRVYFKPSDKSCAPTKLATSSWIVTPHNKFNLEVEKRKRVV